MTVYLNWYGKKKFLSFIETKEKKKREKKKKQNDKNFFLPEYWIVHLSLHCQYRHRCRSNHLMHNQTH